MNKIFTCLMTLVVMMFASNAMAGGGNKDYYATLKVEASGEGIVYIGDDVNQVEKKEQKNQSTAPTFTFKIHAVANEGYKFVKWNDNNTEATREVSLEGKENDYTTTYTATFEKIQTASANLQVTSAGVATFCAPFDVDLAAEEIDAKAYTAEISGEFVKLSELTDGVIPAGTPVVLESNTVINKTLEAVPTVTSETCTEGCLTGNLAAKKEVAEGNYLLQNQAEGLAWYRVANSGLYIGTNRCYLSKTAAGARDFYTMDFDNTTGIDNIATEAKTKADGKYLVNGRIVIIKAGKVYELK